MVHVRPLRGFNKNEEGFLASKCSIFSSRSNFAVLPEYICCMKALGYYNGKMGNPSRLTVSFNDRAVFFGDGVYDATYARNRKIYALDDHLERFFDGLRALDIHLSLTKEDLKDLLCGLAKKTDGSECFVYWQASRGSALRDHAHQEDLNANLYIFFKPSRLKDQTVKVDVIAVDDTRYAHCHVKTLNLLPNVLAYQRAVKEGAGEAVFHKNGRVTEGSQSNIFLLKNGALVTPPADGLILSGITRRKTIEICENLGVPVGERAFSWEELIEADEVFLTSVSRLGIGVCRAGGIPIGGKDGELLKTIQNELYIDFCSQTER